MDKDLMRAENRKHAGLLDFVWAFATSYQKFEGLLAEVSAMPDDSLRSEIFKQLREYLYSAALCPYCTATINLEESKTEDGSDIENNLEEFIECQKCPLQKFSEKIIPTVSDHSGCHKIPAYRAINAARTKTDFLNVLRDILSYMREHETELSKRV